MRPQCSRAVRFVVVASLLCCGCTKPLTRLIGGTPNGACPASCPLDVLPPVESLAGTDQHFKVSVGPPNATLAVSVIEPTADLRPKGTVLLIHGIFGRGLFVAHTARAMANAGYRAVLVDLRGHGRSTGEWLGYGEQEARDLVQVIDALEARGLVAGKLGVYGISYGATTSIHLAAADPRVAAVVAAAPFSTIRDEIPQFAKVIAPGVGWMISDAAYQSAIDEAGRRGNFDPDESTALKAIQRTNTPILLLHGTVDWMVPGYHSQRLHEAAPQHSEFVAMPLLGHTTIWLDPLGAVDRRTQQWFDRWLGDEDMAMAERVAQ